jgi:hypothetical protein
VEGIEDMEELLKVIWQWLGLPQIWGAILTLLLLLVAYLLKRLLDVRIESQKADQDTLRSHYIDIADYVKEQSNGLLRAYVKIFERKSGIEAGAKELIAIIAEADNDLMKPLRKYQAKLDDETKASIFRIHNVLAQYYPDASEAAIENFRRRKAEFYSYIDDAQRILKPVLILYRLGLVSSTLKKERR